MADTDYIERLKEAIYRLHGTDSKHLESVHVEDFYRGETVWSGDVEVFEINSPATRATRCYAWSHGDPEQFIAILGLPPVDSPQAAVRVGIALQTRQRRKGK